MKRLALNLASELAKKRGWTPQFAQGFIAGAMLRIRGKLPPSLAFFSANPYGLGLCAGYLERHGRKQAEVAKWLA